MKFRQSVGPLVGGPRFIPSLKLATRITLSLEGYLAQPTYSKRAVVLPRSEVKCQSLLISHGNPYPF